METQTPWWSSLELTQLVKLWSWGDRLPDMYLKSSSSPSSSSLRRSAGHNLCGTSVLHTAVSDRLDMVAPKAFESLCPCHSPCQFTHSLRGSGYPALQLFLHHCLRYGVSLLHIFRHSGRLIMYGSWFVWYDSPYQADDLLAGEDPWIVTAGIVTELRSHQSSLSRVLRVPMLMLIQSACIVGLFSLPPHQQEAIRGSLLYGTWEAWQNGL